MSARIVQLPRADDADRATIHVTVADAGGYEVAHESCTGNSWGFFSRHATAEEAITQAYRLNREELAGECCIFICEAALVEVAVNAGPAPARGGF